MAPTRPPESADDPEITLAEFFEKIDQRSGPKLTADEHRALVAAVRADRNRSDS